MKGKKRFLYLLTPLVTTLGSPAESADCSDLAAAFHRAVATKSIDAARRAAGDIASDIVCGVKAEEYQGEYLSFLIAFANDPTTAASERDRALSAAEEKTEISGSWKTAAAIGDVYFRRGDRARAFAWYEKGLSFITSRPGTAATLSDKQALVTKAGASKSYESEGQPEQRKWFQSTRAPDGKLSGVYAQVLLREVEVINVPLPVRFVTNEATLTPEGDAAVQELAQAAKEQSLQFLKLIGHADPRGTSQYNLDLSRRRVEAVRDRLKQLGVAARVDIAWKGANQPFDVKVLPYKPSQEESWALDRRVEWVRDGLSE